MSDAYCPFPSSVSVLLTSVFAWGISHGQQPAQKVLSSRGRGILFEIKELNCRRGASSSSFSDAEIEQKTRPQAGMTFWAGCQDRPKDPDSERAPSPAEAKEKAAAEVNRQPARRPAAEPRNPIIRIAIVAVRHVLRRSVSPRRWSPPSLSGRPMKKPRRAKVTPYPETDSVRSVLDGTRSAPRARAPRDVSRPTGERRRTIDVVETRRRRPRAPCDRRIAAASGRRVDILSGEIPVREFLSFLADYTGLSLIVEQGSQNRLDDEITIVADMKDADDSLVEAPPRIERLDCRTEDHRRAIDPQGHPHERRADGDSGEAPDRHSQGGSEPPPNRSLIRNRAYFIRRRHAPLGGSRRLRDAHGGVSVQRSSRGTGEPGDGDEKTKTVAPAQSQFGCLGTSDRVPRSAFRDCEVRTASARPSVAAARRPKLEGDGRARSRCARPAHRGLGRRGGPLPPPRSSAGPKRSEVAGRRTDR